jgi:polyketide cyclase/dehydrase/lipid transport protein
MINVQISIVINRPLEEVFVFLSNLENNLKWRSGMIKAEKISEGPIGVGTTYRMINNFFGRQVEGEAVVTEYELNRKYATMNKSGLPIKTQRVFEPIEGGTRVTFSVETEVGAFFKLVEPLMARIGKRRLEADALMVKEVIESGALR